MKQRVFPDAGVEPALDEYASAHPDAYDVLRDAVRRGEARQPRRRDILVHPEFAFAERLFVPTRFSKDVVSNLGVYSWLYRNRLQKILDGAKDAVVITYGGEENMLRDRYAREMALSYDRKTGIQSHMYDKKSRDSIMTSGRLDWSKFPALIERLDGLHPDDTYVLHGSDFADCVPMFAEQLSVARLWQEFMPPDASRESIDVLHENALQTREALERAGITLGTTFDYRNTYQFLIDQHMEGEYLYRIIGPDSVIIPSRDRNLL